MTEGERDREVKPELEATPADCRFYTVELREVRGSGPLALMERDWCDHPKHSPCDRGSSVWHSSPASGFRNLTCCGQRGNCPLTPEQFEDVE